MTGWSWTFMNKQRRNWKNSGEDWRSLRTHQCWDVRFWEENMPLSTDQSPPVWWCNNWQHCTVLITAQQLSDNNSCEVNLSTLREQSIAYLLSAHAVAWRKIIMSSLYFYGVPCWLWREKKFITVYFMMWVRGRSSIERNNGLFTEVMGGLNWSGKDANTLSLPQSHFIFSFLVGKRSRNN